MSEWWQTFDPGWSLLAILLTLLTYRLALELFQRSGRNALLHPLITAPLPIAATLYGLGITYPDYLDGVALLGWMLGPATVALAIPLYHQMANIRQHALAIALTTAVGGFAAIAIALAGAALLGADSLVLRSLASKSVTTPIALELSQILDGNAQLAAGAVIITGVVGALLGPIMLRSLGITDHRVVGFTLGLTAHGIGTARAFDIDPKAGAYASLGMGLTGLLTGFGLPLILM